MGAWNGLSYLFADFVRILKGIPQEKAGSYLSETSRPYRGYLLWITFPPLLLLFIGEPFGLVIAYGVLGALFMPFLAITLLWLLNSKRVEKPYRNGWITNTLLVACVLLFVVLAFQEISELLNK
ncbi:hypothetical protein GCM10011571_32410 [Marinithermofilum abyssi]|uniref:Natural resistance-associated macrophage protein n=1 Tax=Marinithermofilum abyssi TaxID=1571185 RepID=A0A8J2VLU0_9BACL|nr:hypothetical protein GCM10011571_32410 [Marinithermofilum abyssi]